MSKQLQKKRGRPEPAESDSQISALVAEATVEAANRLYAIAETTADKELRRASRKALYLLSLRGIRPTERGADEVTETSPATAERYQFYATTIDGSGNRMFLVVEHSLDGGNPKLHTIVASETQGILQLHTRRLQRTELSSYFEALEEKFSDEGDMLIAEIEADYGRWLLEEARWRGQRAGKASPNGFLETVREIGPPVGDYHRPPVYARIDGESLLTDLSIPRDATALFQLPWFQTWFLNEDDVQPWLLQSATQGPQNIEVPESVQQARHKAIVADAANNLIDETVREVFVRRLEEIADVLDRKGRREEARQALYHATQLSDNTIRVSDTLFASALIERTMWVAFQLIRERWEASQKQARGE